MAVTPEQKAANAKWLKDHPGWTAKRKAIAKKNAKSTDTTTTVNTRPGIGSSIADYLALKNKLFNPYDDIKEANAVAEAQVTPVSTLQAQADARQNVISNVGAELLKSLGAIQLAGAAQGDAGVKMFTQGATDANDAAAGQAAAAGGVVAPDTSQPAGSTLARMSANTNNILAGQQAAAAKNNALYGRQTESDLQKAIKSRNDDVTKLAAQEYQAKQGRNSTDTSNLLTYNLYNTQDTTKRVIAKETLTLQGAIAAQKAAAKVIDQGIAKENANIKRMLANHEITKDQADRMSKMYKAVEDVYNHQTATSGTPGKTMHKVVVDQDVKVPATTGGPLNDGKDANSQQIYTTQPKRTTLTITDAQWQQFNASGPLGQRKMALLGAQPGAKFISESSTTGAGGKGGVAWTPAQSKQVLIAAGFSAPQVAAIIKTLSMGNTKAGKAAAQALITKLPGWLKNGLPATLTPVPPETGAPYK